MKKGFLFIALFAVALCFYGCESSSLDDETNILPDEIIGLPDLEDVDDVCTKMTDSNFIGYCYENFDVNGDGKVSMAEAEYVTAISCSTAEDFTGIEYFTNLESFKSTSAKILDLRYNAQLTCLDLRYNAQLTYIYCEGVPIKKLDLRDCVNLTSIESSAFRGCSNLASIELPSSLISIDKHAFRGCSSLTTINLPSKLTSLGGSAFRECTSLKSIDFPSSITSIDTSAFYGCSSLASIELPSGLTSIEGSAFCRCSSLTSIELPSGVKAINDFAFAYCTSLISVGFPSSSGLTSIGEYAFGACYSLTSMEFPSGLTSIGSYAFDGCSILKTVTSRPITPPSISSTTFYFCSKLTTLYVPSESVDAYKDSDWASCFKTIEAISE